MRLTGDAWVSVGWATLLLASCGGSSGDGASQDIRVTPVQEGTTFFEPEEFVTAPAANLGTSPLLSVEGSPETPASIDGAAIDRDDACIISQVSASLAREPVDIILLLDNSGSMADELEAVEQNINVNFAQVLSQSEIDYRVILISRHRRGEREESGESSTSVCVTSPLSAEEDCDSAEFPAFSERFFQYSTKVESDDSFDILLDTYEPPFADGHEDRSGLAPEGWSQWLRLDAKKVFLEMTDDNEDMQADDFLRQLTTMAPGHFGSDPSQLPFVFHSIVGLAEKDNPVSAYTAEEPLQEERCQGGDNSVDNAGEVYQRLSVLSGGLRFPLCQFDAYDVVFQQIAEDVATRSALACDLPLPRAPVGTTLDLDKVAISLELPGEPSAQRFGQVRSVEQCTADTFLIDSGQLTLCPQACDAVQQHAEATMQVLFTCENQVVLR